MTYSNADFTPGLKGYSDIKPFRFWCQKVLPLVYDDSLSYYELLCKVTDYINNIITDLATTEENVAALLDAYNQLQSYVNNYFTNLDVQEEINNHLDDLVEDGTLTTLIGNYIQPRIDEINDELDEYETTMNHNFSGLQSATESNLQQQNDKIFVLEGRMDTFSKLTPGSTTGDAELQDIRVSYNGITYPNAGESVRGQGYNFDALLGKISNEYFESINRIVVPQGNISFNYRLDGSGKCVQDTSYKLVKYQVTSGNVIWLKVGQYSEGTFQFQTASNVPSSLPNINLVNGCYKIAKDTLITVPANATWIIISTQYSNNIDGLYNFRPKTLFDISLKNIIGSEGDIKYPVYIPSGTSLTMSTSDHEILNQSGLNFKTYDINGNDLQYWNFPTGNVSRVITLSSDAYYVGWNSTPNRELQVEVGEYYTQYVKYALDTRTQTVINNVLKSLTKDSALTQMFNSAYHKGATNFAEKSKEFSSLLYGDTLTDVNAPVDFETFLFFTDPHLMQETGWEDKCYEFIAQIQKYYNSTPTSFCLCGGDWLGNNDLPSEACFKLGYIDGFMHSLFDNCHLIVGNHDTNYQGKLTSESERYTTRLSNQSIADLWYRSNKKAYYKFNGDNTTFYLFDTGTEAQSLTSYDNYGLTQVKWFAESLLTDNSPHIALTSHILYNDLPSNSNLCPIMQTVADISKAYNDRSSIEVDGVTYDYTNNTGKIEFMVCGHSHGDFNGTINNIPYFLTINASVNSVVASFDLVLVNYDTRMIKLIRVGNGSNRTISLN